jgi:flagellar hook-length control protein FliK
MRAADSRSTSGAIRTIGGHDRAEQAARAAPPAPFAQALAQLRAPSGGATMLAEAAQRLEAAPAAQSEASTSDDDVAPRTDEATDSGLNTDAASAALAAVLQWLHPVTAVQSNDSQQAEAGAGEDQGVALGGISALAAQGGRVAGSGAEPGLAESDSALQDAADSSDAAHSREAPAAPGTSPAQTQAPGGLELAGAWRVASSVLSGAERTVPVSVHDRHWPQAMAAQVLVLADQKIDSATLRLSPEHLGPVEVHIEVQAQGVNVSFGAQHAETRAALEQALPQLRAAFAGAGLSLGQATVQQQMRRESQNALASMQASGEPADHLQVSPALIRSIGLVDEYV